MAEKISTLEDKEKGPQSLLEWLRYLHELIAQKLFLQAQKEGRDELTVRVRDLKEKMKAEDDDDKAKGILAQIRELIEEDKEKSNHFHQQRASIPLHDDRLGELSERDSDLQGKLGWVMDKREEVDSVKTLPVGDEVRKKVVREVEKKLREDGDDARSVLQETRALDDELGDFYEELDREVNEAAETRRVLEEEALSTGAREVMADLAFVRKSVYEGGLSPAEADGMIADVRGKLRKKFERSEITREERADLEKQFGRSYRTNSAAAEVKKRNRGKLTGGGFEKLYSARDAKTEAKMLRAMGEGASGEQLAAIVDEPMNDYQRGLYEDFRRSRSGDVDKDIAHQLAEYGALGAPPEMRGRDYYYQQAVAELRDELGLGAKEEISKDQLEEYVRKLMKRIVRSGESSHDPANMQTKYMWVALSTKSNLSTTGDFEAGLREFPHKFRELYEVWMTVHDFDLYAFKCGGAEAFDKGSSKMDAQFNSKILREGEEYKIRYKILKDGKWSSVEVDEVDLRVADFYNMANSEYWSRRLLSTIASEGEQAREDILEHLIAVKLGRRQAYDYERFYGKSARERASAAFKANKDEESGFLVSGVVFGKNGKQENGSVHDLFDEVRWQWQFAEGIWHSTLRSSVYAKAFGNKSYHLPDWMAKTIRFKDWARSFGVCRVPFMEHADLHYGDFETERFGDLYGHVIDAVTKANEGVISANDLKEGMKLIMMSKEGFLLSPHEMIKLMDKHKGRFFGDSKASIFHRENGRFGYLSRDERDKYKKIYDSMLELDWSAGAAVMKATEAAWAGSAKDKARILADARRIRETEMKGAEGFKAMLHEDGVEKRMWEGDDVFDLDTGDPIGKGMWEARAKKYTEYFLGAYNTRGLLLAFFAMPTRDNLLKIAEAGFPYFDKDTKSAVLTGIFLEALKLRNPQWVYEFYKAGESRMLRPIEKEGEMVLSVEGENQYEKRKVYACEPGRMFGIPDIPAFVQDSDIDDLRAADAITTKDKERLKDESIREVPFHNWLNDSDSRLARVLNKVVSVDPFSFTKDTWAEGLLYSRFRLGLGPIIAFYKLRYSYIVWSDYWRDVRDDWMKLFGQGMKEAVEVA